MTRVEWSRKRGWEDARAAKPALFRSTRARGIVECGDDNLSDEWTLEMREAYLAGYEEGAEFG